jgi:hypothetical protein
MGEAIASQWTIAFTKTLNGFVILLKRTFEGLANVICVCSRVEFQWVRPLLVDGQLQLQTP